MLEALKRWFQGNRPEARLAEALRPLSGESQSLYSRCLNYVVDGQGDEVLIELRQAKGSHLARLMHNPGILDDWLRPPRAVVDVWRRLGLEKHGVQRRRFLYYASEPSPEELIRFGRLIVALGADIPRIMPDVPAWLTALTNDVITTFPDRREGPDAFWRRLRRWTAQFLIELLTTDGMAIHRAAPTVVLAMCQGDSSFYPSSLIAKEMPGLDGVLAEHGHLLSPEMTEDLEATGRTLLMERATAIPEVAAALAPVIAAFTIDSAKGPRTAALQALGTLPPPRRAEVIRPILATVTVARGADLLAVLASDIDGITLLEETAASDAKIASEAERIANQSVGPDVETTPGPALLPPFQSIPNLPAGQEVMLELRAKVANLPPAREQTSSWLTLRREPEFVPDEDLQDFVAVANGAGVRSSLLARFSIWWLADAAPSLTLIHLLRLQRVAAPPFLSRVIGLRTHDRTDLRTIEEAIWNAGVHYDQIGAAGIAPDQIAHQALTLSPEAAWPWFVQNLDIWSRWLQGETAQVASSLQIVAACPELPGEVGPLVSRIAVAGAITNQRLAQAALTRHAVALDLATHSLAGSKETIRSIAATWIGDIGDPAGIKPLRARLEKETRPKVRAAILTALEALGDDISADLAPDALLAEAAKGLKPKTPVALSWFNFDELPGLQWRDGSDVDPKIVSWWFALAVKQKNPDGSGLFDRFLSLLDDDSATQIGRHALTSWITQDTRYPTEDESREYAAAEGPKAWRQAQENLELARATSDENPSGLKFAKKMAGKSVEEHTKEAFQDHQDRYLTSAIPAKGMLALTTRMPGDELADATQNFIRNHGARRAQVESLVHALSANGSQSAVQLLLSIASRFNQATVKAKARELADQLAESLGWTPDELADRSIPTAGLDDDGLLRLSYGPREFLGYIDAKLLIGLTDAEGDEVHSLPRPRSDDDSHEAAQAKKRLTAARKELTAIVACQTSRLYEAMCSYRRWSVGDWRQHLLQHAVMPHLLTRLVWCEAPQSGPVRTFRPTTDGRLIDVKDDPVELAPGSQIQIAHRVLGAEIYAEGWIQHIARHDVAPLFDQFSATMPRYLPGAVAVEDLRGHRSDTFAFRGVATRRGYERRRPADAAWFTEYTKNFSNLDLTAVIGFTGSQVPEKKIACATEFLSFENRGRRIYLEQVPPILLAECYADYAAFAALGPYDPGY